MTRHRILEMVGLAIGVGIALIWWFFIVDWISHPRSYRAGVVYICAVLFSSGWHYRALFRFNRMVRLVTHEEKAGIAPPGSVTFAANQRFRYAMRSLESIVVLVIGVLAIWSVSDPAIQLNKNYIRLVITYFIGSILLTGYLTVRDLWVLEKVRKLAPIDDDAVLLHTTHSKEGEVLGGTKPHGDSR